MSDFTSAVNKSNSNLHSYSGALLIVVDNALWGANVVTLGLATSLVSLLAFGFTRAGAFLVQIFIAEDSVGVAVAKGFVLGVMAGVPTSVVGTLGEFLILGQAGLKTLRARQGLIPPF